MKNLYFVGIGGAGLSALAECAQDAGYHVAGSDQEASHNTELLAKRGIQVIEQTGSAIAKYHHQKPIEWVVVSSSISSDHPEVKFAKDNNIKVTKRDELINEIIKTKKLKLIAVSGTHGKTTTTGMLIWLFKEFKHPLSYVLGTNITFGPSGQYEKNSEYIVLEADEFDRHMLAYKPFMSLLPSVEYDHPDTYPSVDDYKQAFRDFITQTHCTFTWAEVAEFVGAESKCLHTFRPKEVENTPLTLFSKNRDNAFLAAQVFHDVFPEAKLENIYQTLNNFPGTERRMERLADNLYSDYAHHPTEIRAALKHALAINKEVVIFYQPHQNIRQHEIQEEYGNCFSGVKKVYWLPTYLSRENPELKTLEPSELVAKLENPKIAETAEMNEELVEKVNQHLKNGELVLIMGAGSIDPWARENLL